MKASRNVFDRMEAAAHEGPAAILSVLAGDLAAARRWHALFDARLLEARLALGLPPAGELGQLDRATREALDERSLAACREVGWPLFAEGQVAAAWMYLRAVAEPAEVAASLSTIVSRDDLADAANTRAEALQLALHEGIDPALGIRLAIEDHGTCAAITAYAQWVARLPSSRRRPAADCLVDHLHDECVARGNHVDVSHLHNVLEIARECTDRVLLGKALALAEHAMGIPEDMLMPGEPPFEELALASRHFFRSQLGPGRDEAIDYFHRKAEASDDDPLSWEWLAVLQWRTGLPGDALRTVIGRPAGAGAFATGLLPSIVEMARASGDWAPLLDHCRDRDDAVTFAAALAAHQSRHQSR